ncbi:MAG: helix-turn-helix transcriptional regulator [Lachnospiraceae bacterium]|nr:helix-turn-helix transcriptional regulator [Lachnospiraceae bacterium]
MNKIGQNIKKLRKAYGETQPELGQAINVEYSTISMYESGKRQPDIQTLQAIASHYGYTLDQLLREDFSHLDFTKTMFTWDSLVNLLEIIFPLSCSNTSKEDIYFMKGYEYTQEILTSLKKGENILRRKFELALESYCTSMETYETTDSAANTLWLIYVLYTLLPDKQFENMGKALYFGKATGNDFLKNYVLKNEITKDKAEEENKLSYIRDMNESITAYIQCLKKIPSYANLADYYLALRYVIGMVDTDYSNELTKTIGMEMMLSFLSIGNPYAFEFVQKSLEI